ncbi:glutathione S-transferase [Oceanospirillum sediminis]|uniref:Glutathione S-transferase n=1 Tax=Oceanospirillum sediminis TaxID=2760088 RepID=A0A839IP99_9GAMM|nr:glutathione S-transferase [Oceanospirillum sediminis]MBB1486342.1 glutathione S-transferase [Oceanospirillum sediminis]
MTDTAILYSFRRCPYAMRARLAIMSAGQQVELREIVLKNKPEHMLTISPKGTVPVLILPDGQVIDESRDIMQWALNQSDPDGLLKTPGGWQYEALQQKLVALTDYNDGEFKHWLDRYKYADRYPEKTAEAYRQKGEHFLLQLEQLLAELRTQSEGDYPAAQARPVFLSGEAPCLADITIMPFIRQFAHVDRDWFYKAPYPELHAWLQWWIASDLFTQAMKKYSPWCDGDEPIYILN